MTEQQVVLITGAAGGIGYAMAEGFAGTGATVILCDLDKERVTESVNRLKAQGYSCIGLAFDVTEEEAVRQAVTTIETLFGRLDVLVNNAGMQHVAPLEEFPTAVYERMLRLMLVAPFVAIKHVLPIMRKRKYGRILNMSSINGLVGFSGKAAYNSAKHGLIGLTKVAALEAAADGITVNALCPGYVDTPLVRNQLDDLARTRGVPLESVLEEVIYPLVPQRRLLRPEEIADYAVFLCSGRAGGVTGQAAVIDGGYLAQ